MDRGIVMAMIACHDAGKVNPWFQQKVTPGMPRLPPCKVKLSYHVQVSAVVFYLACIALNKHQPLTQDQQAALFAIATHHDKTLPDAPGMVIGINEARDFLETLREVSVDDMLVFVMNTSKAIQDRTNIPCLSGLDGVLPEIKSILTALQGAIGSDKSAIKVVKLWNNMLGAQHLHGDSHETSRHEFACSLLFDLDTWDAGFFIPEANLHQPTGSAFPHSVPVQLGGFNTVETYCLAKFGHPRDEPTDNPTLRAKKLLRRTVEAIDAAKAENLAGKVVTLTAPTGAGKTLAMLDLALRVQATRFALEGHVPRVIYCLPFLALGKQIVDEIKKATGMRDDEVHSRRLVVHNYLTPMRFRMDEDGDYITGKGARWHVVHWQGDFVVSTFVQLFASCFSGGKTDVSRLHHLAGAILLLDEVQTIPIKYWDVVAAFLQDLASVAGTTVIMSTATQPHIIEPPVDELATPLLNNPVMQDLDRYEMTWHPDVKNLGALIERVVADGTLVNQDVMVVVNTTTLARSTWETIENTLAARPEATHDVFLLSGLVTPRDRANLLDDIIKLLKAPLPRKRVLLVCTQLIEAGVDVSFDIVFRDIAPLDSIVQVAGRCNRYGKNKGQDKGQVHIVNLHTGNGKLYAGFVYASDLTDVKRTKACLDAATHDGQDTLTEVQLRALFTTYYKGTRVVRDTSRCAADYRDARFKMVRVSFSYIDEIENRRHLFIPVDAEAREILATVENDDGKHATFPARFYEHAIQVDPRRLAPSWYRDARAGRDGDAFLVLEAVDKYNARGGLEVL